MDLTIYLDNTLLLVLERLVHNIVTICVHGLTELCALSKDNHMLDIDQNINNPPASSRQMIPRLHLIGTPF